MRDAGDHEDEDDLRDDVRFGDARVPEPRGDLQHTEAERGRDAEHGTDDGDRVDRIAPAALHALAEQRLDRPPDRHRAPLAMHGVRQRHTHDRVDRPGVESPVEIGLTHGLLGQGLLGARDPGARLEEVCERLTDTVEDQTDPHPGGEQHGEPGQERELRFVVVLAELDVAELRDGEDDRHDDEPGDEQDVVPPEASDDPGLDGVEDGLGLFREQDREQRDTEDDHEGRPEHPGDDLRGGVTSRRVGGGDGLRAHVCAPRAVRATLRRHDHQG